MVIVNPSLTQFNTGEITPFLMGRSDFKKYPAAAQYMENCLPLVYGPFLKRSGTRYVNRIKTYNSKTILKPFIFSKTQAYTLEIGVGYIRFHTKNGTLVGKQAVVSPQSSIRARCTNAETFGTKVADEPDTYTFTYDGTDWLYNSTIVNLAEYAIDILETPEANDEVIVTYLGSGIVDLATPFTAEDLDNLDFAQSNDFLYIASGRLPVKVLKRYAATTWALEDVEFIDGPYQDENLDKSIKVKSSVKTAESATVITSTKDLFTPEMVGKPIRLRAVSVGSSADNAIGWATITEYINPKQVNGIVEEQFFNTDATYAWRIGEFLESRGYPKKVTLFKGRLCLASTKEKPNSLWLSRADSYQDFGPTTLLDNEVNDDDAIYLTMAATQTNQIQWMSALRQLFIGTLGSEFRIGGTNEVITPKNCSSEEISQYGSTSIPPCKYANELVYVQQAERKIRTMYYDFGTDAYNSTDLSLFGEHLTYSGIAGIAQQVEPFSTIWAWLNNGNLRSVSYQKDQEVVAWARQNLGGNRVRVLSACVIPYIEENRDQVWLLVERWINGSFVQYIETLDRVFDDQVSQEMGYFVDCGGTYNNPLPITNIVSDNNQTIITCPNHGLTNGAKIKITEIANHENSSNLGYDNLNTKSFYVQVHDVNTIIIQEDTSGYVSYASWQGGVIRAYISQITRGLSHLEGEEVWAVVDGAVTPKTRVVNGSVTLDIPGTIVHIGLPYTCKYKSVRLDTALGQNNSLASKQRIHHLYIKVHRTNYFLYGANEATELKPARKYTVDRLDFAPKLKTELVEIPFEVDWTREPCITIVSDLPLPLCILGITTQMSLNIS